jgi:putative endonuclease
MTRNQQLGRWGEKKAREYLEGKGLNIIETNVRTAYGELDIVGREGSQIVFIEVKTRTSLTFGYGEQAINELKKQHLMGSAEAYMQSHPDLGVDWRIDAVIIDGDLKKNKIEIRWYKNAVSGE